MGKAAHVHVVLTTDPVNTAELGRMSWAAAEGKCFNTLIVGTSRVLDFNIDLCALQMLRLPVNNPAYVATNV